MILVNSYEIEFLKMFSRIFANQSGTDNTIDDKSTEMARLRKELREMLSHYSEKALINYRNRLKDLYGESINLSFNCEGEIFITPKISRLTNLKEISRIISETLDDLAINEVLLNLRRILALEVCSSYLEEKNVRVNPRDDYHFDDGSLMQNIFIDESFPVINDQIIGPEFAKLLNQIKRNVEKDEKLDELLNIYVDEHQRQAYEKFKEQFLSKFVGEMYENFKVHCDYITNYSIDFLKSLYSYLDRIGNLAKFVPIARKSLFEKLFGQSLIFEIYVFRKIADAGIPCLFGLELKDKSAQFDLVYCGEAELGVIEVKSGKAELDASRLEKLLSDGIFKKYILVGAERFERCIPNNVTLLYFKDLSDITKLSSLIKDL